MSARDVIVTCPCCNSRLDVDVRTGKVVKWKGETEVDETGKPVMRDSDWQAAQARAMGRQNSAEEKFDAGFAREKNRAADLDDLFKKASEKLKKREDDEEDAG